MTKAVTQYNHIESDIPGDSYRRVKEMRLLNPKGGIKSIEYYQEDFINLLNNQKTTTNAPVLRFQLDSNKLSEVIDLVNPDTGEIIGKKSLAEIVQTTFLFAHSLYIYTENDEMKKSPLLNITPNVSPVVINTPVDNYVEPVIISDKNDDTVKENDNKEVNNE